MNLHSKVDILAALDENVAEIKQLLELYESMDTSSKERFALADVAIDVENVSSRIDDLAHASKA